MKWNSAPQGPAAPADLDQAWRDAPLPEEHKAAWRRVTQAVTESPERAVRLAAHGWTPESVAASRITPSEYWPAELRAPLDTREGTAVGDAERIAALAVLADDVADYHAAQAAVARDARSDYFAALNASGWTHARIATLCSVSKQRIQILLANRRARYPKPPH